MGREVEVIVSFGGLHEKHADSCSFIFIPRGPVLATSIVRFPARERNLSLLHGV
jgi:hypothetical protein